MPRRMVAMALAVGLVFAGRDVDIDTMPAMDALPPGDIGFGRFLDSRNFTVTFTSFSGLGEVATERLARDLPPSWDRATEGTSRVRVVDGEADIQIIVVFGPGNSTGGGRLITLRVLREIVGDPEMTVLLHELGHSLGCCFGPGANAGGHWVTCARGADLMCSSGPYPMRFSERELRALRLR